MKILKTGIFAIISFLLIACSKDEGKGGLASIKGVVMVQNVNYHNNELFGALQPAQGERVFILYGNSSAVGNDTRTSFDGSFEFPFLVQGDYSVYAFSDDTTNVNGAQVEIKKSISLSSKKAKVHTDTIIIYQFVEFDEGSSSISGKVARTHSGNPVAELDEDDNSSGVQDYEVFLTLLGNSEVLERARTDAKGEFTFSHLIPATYFVYTFEAGQDFNEKPIKSETVTITTDNEHKKLNAFRVYKK